MSMTAMKVLERAQELGMLDPKVIDELRRQVEESKFHVSPEAIVKVLVDKKHLTQFQAKKLVSEVSTEPEPTSAAKGQTASPKPPSKATPSFDDDDLLNLDPAPERNLKSPAAPADDDVVDLEEALPPAGPIKAPVKPLGPVKPGGPEKSKPRKTPQTTDEDIVTLEPVEDRNRPTKSKPATTPQKPQPEGPKPGPAPARAGAPSAGLTPLSPGATAPGVSAGLSPLPSPVSPGGGLTPLTPAPPPGLSPIGPGPTPTPGLSPMGPAPSPGLSPLGPLPGLSPAGMADPMMADSLGGLGPPPPPKPEPGIKKKRAGGWDSPLLLIGGGSLGVLVIAFVALYVALTRGSAQEVYEQANEAYRSGSYNTAITIYNKFVTSYPDDPNVSTARVKIGMARLHQNYDGQKDMSGALKAAQDVLPRIEVEEDFEEARAELESMLPSIADNFATSAKASTDVARMEKYVEQAHAAMKLVNNPTYLPTTRRKNQEARIDAIQEKIRVAERTINQDKALDSAMVQLQEKLTAGDIVGAYQVREKLLQEYPTLQTNADVVKNTLAISQRERDLVTTSPQTQAAAADDPHRATHAHVVLAKRSGDTLSAPQDAAAFLLVRGSVYALDVASGKIRWRRFVGADTRIRPATLSGGDALVADESHLELLRLAGATGKVVWRQSLGEPFAAPQQLGEHLFVSLLSGRVVRINTESGEVDRAAQLPQRARVAGGVDPRAKVLIQPGEHSTLFTLAAEESAGEPLACRAAYYLGHAPGSIAVPPVVVVGYVFVFENTGVDSSRVHILGPGEKGSLEPVRDAIGLRGRITVPPANYGRRLIVVSELGDAMVIDIDPANTANPVSITAKMAGGLSQPTLGFHALSGSQLLIADTRLAEYEIVATKQSLDRGSSSFDGDAFLSPLQLFGSNLIHVRQRQGGRSVTVTGVNLSDNKSWQLTLSSPLAGVYAFPEQKQFSAVSSDGDLFEVTLENLQDGLRDQPTASAGGSFAQSYSPPIGLAGGRSLFLERAGKRWIVYEPRLGGTIKKVDAQTPDAISASPASFGGGVLAPLVGGSIWLLDVATGAPLSGATPFQPQTAPGAPVKWLPPLPIDERQFIAIDAGRKMMYLARREEKPTPFLAETRSVPLDDEPVYAAIVGKTLLVVARGQASDEIIPHALPSLDAGKRIGLESRVGPRGLEVIGDSVFCETSARELLKILPTNEVAWRAKLTDVPLIAAPISSGADWMVVAQNGGVSLVKGDSGEVIPKTSIGQPLTSAQAFGSRLVAGGADGTLHIVDAK